MDTLEIAKKVFFRLVSPKMWGLKPDPDGGWVRPELVEYNGEWYIKKDFDDKKVFKNSYNDFSEDIRNGEYVPTGVKVGEE